MKVEHHFIAVLPIMGIVYLITGKLSAVLMSFIGHILIDLDHLPDYYFSHKKNKSISINHFFESCSKTDFKKLYLVFHSYEILIILIILNLFFYNVLITGLLAGFSSHLFLDQCHNNIKQPFYFFVYRWSNNFETKKICNINN